MTSDLTTNILREIRDEIREVRGEIRSTNQRIDVTNQRLEETHASTSERFDLLGRRIVESEMRTATALTELAGAVGSVRDLLAENLAYGPRLAKCEHDIEWLRARVGP